MSKSKRIICKIISIKAFTILELIIVITIIALLVTITSALLNRARESAKRCVCASNLHQIGLAAQSYANENNSFLPPFHDAGGLHYRWPNQSYVAYNKKPIGAGPWNMAFLYENNYIHDSRMFYCPSQKHDDHAFETYPHPWGEAAPEGKFYIYVSYSFNPYVHEQDELNKYKRLTEMPQNKILALDIPVNWSTAHKDQLGWNWNTLFPDMHVERNESSDASALILSEPDIVLDWTTFSELMQLLETKE